MNVKPLNPIVEEFMPYANKLMAEGMDPDKIQDVFAKILEKKRRGFYRKPIMHTTGSIINSMKLFEIFEKNKNSADSNAERIFYDMLKESGIRFTFQRQIGPYRVDYLVDGFLVLELDGPQHEKAKTYDAKRDAYMKHLGYKVYRVPLMVLINNPSKIIENIHRGIEKYRTKKAK
jgi:very-short-patch-repair endonuclease